MILIWTNLINSFLTLHFSVVDCRAPDFSLIKGGIKASKEDFPFIVLVQTEGNGGAGAILNEKWIITAAHVVNKEVGDKFKFIDWKISVIPKFDNSYAELIMKSDEHSRGIEKRFCLPPLKNEPRYFSDLALLKLSKSIPLDKPPYNSKSIPIANPKTVDWNGEIEIAGWGQTEHQPLSLELLKTSMKITAKVNNRLCKTSPKAFCGAGENSFPCQGDSGGPGVMKNRGTSSYELVGVISFGDTSCKEFGGFTNVTAHKAWIQNVMTNEPKDMECQNVLEKV